MGEQEFGLGERGERLGKHDRGFEGLLSFFLSFFFFLLFSGFFGAS